MDDVEEVLIDASVLISCGRRESDRFQALVREARQRDGPFSIPPQVYAEVTGDTSVEEYESSENAVETALQEGWLRVTESPSYSNPDISSIMDQARRFIATASNRSEDIVEKADTAMVGIALETLADGTADRVLIVTNDIPLGEAAEALIPKYGFDENQITWVTGGDLVAELDSDTVPEFE